MCLLSQRGESGLILGCSYNGHAILLSWLSKLFQKTHSFLSFNSTFNTYLKVLLFLNREKINSIAFKRYLKTNYLILLCLTSRGRPSGYICETLPHLRLREHRRGERKRMRVKISRTLLSPSNVGSCTY